MVNGGQLGSFRGHVRRHRDDRELADTWPGARPRPQRPAAARFNQTVFTLIGLNI